MHKHLYLLTGIFLLLTSAIQGYAQPKATNMKFRGVSMCDSLKIFIEKLEQKGFTQFSTSEDLVLRGTLFFSPVLVNIVTSPKSNVISKIIVLINTESTFQATHTKYLSFLYALMEKYGNPTDSLKGSTYEPLSKSHREDLDKSVLNKDGIKYVSSWLMTDGEIILYISNKLRVILLYYDRLNLEKANNEFKQIIDDEL